MGNKRARGKLKNVSTGFLLESTSYDSRVILIWKITFKRSSDLLCNRRGYGLRVLRDTTYSHYGENTKRRSIFALLGRLRPKELPFSGLRVGISQVEVYKRVRKSVIYVFKGLLIIIF